MRQHFSIGDRYELRGLLGSGGMGFVYRAYDARLGREVALKVLGEHHAGSPEFVERFGREVKSVASLDHPNIVRVFDSGEGEDGSPYMAMELVDGGTLKDRIRHAGPLPPREAARVALQVADALGAAHSAGIVHRDVKPENVLLTEDGEVKVADFGIARATEATAMTHTSMILGTAPYLSPEQARGEPVGPASDLYSLGVVLYEALTGRTPFGTGEHVNPLAIAMKHCTEPAPSPRASNRGVPRPLELITLTLMRKRPSERHASAAVLADDLAAFLRGEKLPSAAVAGLASSAEGSATQTLRRAPKAPTRRRRKVLPVMALALAGVLGLAFSPLVPMQTPVAFVEGAVAPDAGGLDRAVSPAFGSHPGAPEAPEKEERTQETRPEEQDPEPEPEAATDPTPPVEADPITPPDAPAEADPVAPPDAPAEVNAGSASASAGAPASASASSSAGASAAASSAPAGSAPAAEAEPAEPIAEAPAGSAPTPEPDPPSSPAVEAAPAPAPEPEASAPAPDPEPDASAPADDDGGAQVPEVQVPDVEVPDF